MTVNSAQRLVFGNVLEDCKDSVFDIKPTYIITTFLYYRRPVTLIKNFIGAVGEGGGAGTTPQSQVCPPLLPPMNFLLSVTGHLV